MRLPDGGWLANDTVTEIFIAPRTVIEPEILELGTIPVRVIVRTRSNTGGHVIYCDCDSDAFAMRDALIAQVQEVNRESRRDRNRPAGVSGGNSEPERP